MPPQRALIGISPLIAAVFLIAIIVAAAGVIDCPVDFSKVVVSTNCGGVSAEFSKSPKC